MMYRLHRLRCEVPEQPGLLALVVNSYMILTDMNDMQVSDEPHDVSYAAFVVCGL